MKIVYFGELDPDSTSRHRADALRRLGHEVRLINPYPAAGLSSGNRYISYFHYRTGYRFIQSRMLRWIKSLSLNKTKAEVIWVNGGEFFGSKCLKWLKQYGAPVILYNNDDPTGTRDGRRFERVRESIGEYDLCAVMREVNVPEYRALGARKVLRVMMSYDEVVHAPVPLDLKTLQRYAADASFIGTWMPERGPFLARLMQLGVPLSIWGDRWHKAPEWKLLQRAWRGPGLKAPEYVQTVTGSKVALGLLSKGNRDLHTQRSFEIPCIGGLFCAERTKEHEFLYRDGVEAVFWNDAEECARHCLELLANPEKREAIRRAGQRRVRELKAGNEDVCRLILSELFMESFVTGGKVGSGGI